jgi:hypothetical protein
VARIPTTTPTTDRPARLREIIRQTCAEMRVQIVKGVLSTDHVHMFLSIPPRLRCRPADSRRDARDECHSGFGLPDEIAQSTTVEIGIGINTGPACVGNVGSAERFNYSVMR